MSRGSRIWQSDGGFISKLSRPKYRFTTLKVVRVKIHNVGTRAAFRVITYYHTLLFTLAWTMAIKFWTATNNLISISFIYMSVALHITHGRRQVRKATTPTRQQASKIFSSNSIAKLEQLRFFIGEVLISSYPLSSTCSRRSLKDKAAQQEGTPICPLLYS